MVVASGVAGGSFCCGTRTASGGVLPLGIGDVAGVVYLLFFAARGHDDGKSGHGDQPDLRLRRGGALPEGEGGDYSGRISDVTLGQAQQAFLTRRACSGRSRVRA